MLNLFIYVVGNNNECIKSIEWLENALTSRWTLDRVDDDCIGGAYRATESDVNWNEWYSLIVNCRSCIYT